jgi:integrase
MRAQRYATGAIRKDKRRGTWHYQAYDGSGKRWSKLIGTIRDFPTKSSAWREVHRRNLDNRTTEIQNTGELVRSMVTKFQEEKMSKRHSTARVYRSFLNNHILPKWGDTPIQNLRPRLVELWLKELPLSPKSRTHVRSILHLLVDYAMWAEIIPEALNPISKVTNEGATKRVREPRSLTTEEFQKLSAELHEPHRTIARVCVCFGLRISECLALRWSDVDLQNSKLNIERAIVEKHIDTTKTEESRQVMDIPGEVMQALEDWRKATNFREDSDWIFASPIKHGREPYSYTGVWRELDRAASKAGIGHLGTHAFRHTFRSWLDAVDVKPTVQQKLMRHTDIRTTFNIYGNVVTDEMTAAGARVAQLVFQGKGTQAEREGC